MIKPIWIKGMPICKQRDKKQFETLLYFYINHLLNLFFSSDELDNFSPWLEISQRIKVNIK